jgi:hypothetical protein
MRLEKNASRLNAELDRAELEGTRKEFGQALDRVVIAEAKASKFFWKKMALERRCGLGRFKPVGRGEG